MTTTHSSLIARALVCSTRLCGGLGGCLLVGAWCTARGFLLKLHGLMIEDLVRDDGGMMMVMWMSMAMVMLIRLKDECGVDDEDCDEDGDLDEDDDAGEGEDDDGEDDDDIGGDDDAGDDDGDDDGGSRAADDRDDGSCIGAGHMRLRHPTKTLQASCVNAVGPLRTPPA